MTKVSKTRNLADILNSLNQCTEKHTLALCYVCQKRGASFQSWESIRQAQIKGQSTELTNQYSSKGARKTKTDGKLSQIKGNYRDMTTNSGYQMRSGDRIRTLVKKLVKWGCHRWLCYQHCTCVPSLGLLPVPHLEKMLSWGEVEGTVCKNTAPLHNFSSSLPWAQRNKI